MIISCIVAVGTGNVIGLNNNIPWYLPADLQYFKRTTIGNHVIMGRSSYHSIGKPLPKRTNIIITKDPFFIVSNCLIAHSIEEALSLAFENGEEECFIIGGGQIYRQTVDFWDRLYITEVQIDVKGDTFFPTIQLEDWMLKSEVHNEPDEKNPYHYTFKVYERL